MTQDNDNKQDLESTDRILRWNRLLGQCTLTLSGGLAGVVLYSALFPGFYYMDWAALMPLLWLGVVFLNGIQALVLQWMASRKRVPMPSTAKGPLRFTLWMLVLVTCLVALKVPLRASFLLAKPGLELALKNSGDHLEEVGRVSYNFGLYQIGSADRRCHEKDRVFFQFLNDHESAIIYSESGIDGLCYNSGNKGHLMGNWYWMKED
jgi:hypothetical protein